MSEAPTNLTATTSESGHDRHGLGVALAATSGPFEYLVADLEALPAVDWTTDMATELLRHHGYELVGEWTVTGADEWGRTWTAPITAIGLSA
ncbi:hypothetical protein [Rhodococcoides kroppenstedtii]|uniref:hypothetical protein n=1 Tax=Rhodococcoides kroppenstedtii TaxID=293050 RepID=UPI0028EA66A2|nr:hypothetical protein [Rhodococcus kroppenstedtii]